MIIFSLLPIIQMTWAQNSANYKEEKVPTYTLPPFFDGNETGSPNWKNRRKELLQAFENHVYGKTPQQKISQRYTLIESDEEALEGRAIRKQVEIVVSRKGKNLPMNLLLYLPKDSPQPIPVFLGLNFHGNHTIHSDPQILITSSWVRDNEKMGAEQNRASAKGRGMAASRWPVESLIERGYGLAVMYCGDSDPDVDDGFQNGVHPLFLAEGQSQPGSSEWGTIGAWAWSLSRAMDYLETEAAIDSKRVAVIGHSRLGKTALWAGAQDERFAMVISNNSGCGGAALFRRKFGETAQVINTNFPHWFCDAFESYNNCEENLPVDQHMLLALVAPRLLYVASATADQWADPKGEFLATVRASELYQQVYEQESLKGDMPSANTPIQAGKIAYHLREGKHDITPYDWDRYLDFADSFWK